MGDILVNDLGLGAKGSSFDYVHQPRELTAIWSAEKAGTETDFNLRDIITAYIAGKQQRTDYARDHHTSQAGSQQLRAATGSCIVRPRMDRTVPISS